MYDQDYFSAPTVSTGSDLDRNPDANQSVLQATGRSWVCSPPPPSGDTDSDPAIGVAFISCYSTGASAGPDFDSSGSVIATINFTVLNIATQVSNLSLRNVNLYGANGVEIGSCAPTVTVEATCTDASVEDLFGMLRVTTNPGVPAQILVDGVIRDTWGLNWLKLAPGDYTLGFTGLGGYTPPADQQVTVTSGQTTTAEGDYVQRGYLRVTTSDTGGQPPTIYVDGSPRDDWGIWPDLEPGTYQVCFGAVPDYQPPACQNAT